MSEHNLEIYKLEYWSYLNEFTEMFKNKKNLKSELGCRAVIFINRCETIWA